MNKKDEEFVKQMFDEDKKVERVKVKENIVLNGDKFIEKNTILTIETPKK